MKVVIINEAKQRGRDGRVVRRLGCAVIEDGETVSQGAAVTIAITDTGESQLLARKTLGDILELT